MVFWGPWITPPLQSITGAAWDWDGDTEWGSLDWWFADSFFATTVDFATKCEGGGDDAHSSTVFARTTGISDTACEQGILAFQLDDALTFFHEYTDYVFPPNAITVQSDLTNPLGIRWLDHVDLNIPVDVGNIDAVRYDVQMRTSNAWNVNDPIYVPGAQLESHNLAGQFSIPVGTSFDATIRINATLDGTSVVPNVGGDTLTHYFGVLRFHWTNNISHIPPVAITGTDAAQVTVSRTDQMTATVYWQPRNYRFGYAQLPPLRQFPRDDALVGNAGARQTHEATSAQDSARQGWSNTYR